MKRYYITRVLGSGVRGANNPYRPELRDYIYANWPNESHFLKQVIHPNVIAWAVMAYDLSDPAHADVMANVTGIMSFPSGALSQTMSEIPLAKRNEIQTKLENIGFEFAWATGSTTVLQVLKYLNRSIQIASWARVSISAANFDLNKTVSTIPVEARNRIKQHMNNLGIDHSWILGTHTIGEVVIKIQRHSSDGSRRLFGVLTRAQWFFQDDD